MFPIRSYFVRAKIFGAIALFILVFSLGYFLVELAQG
jgi:hypothetical protein